jgi:CBS domain containing-hemolysin-like protein
MDIPFVPEVMNATDLMNRFIKERLSIACVVDEFGSVSGIITLEDILEEIFGEIEDEYDQEDYIERQISEQEYLFSGRLEIDQLNNKYDLGFPDGEYQTLSGYLVMTTETIPDQGAVIELEGYRFVLEQVSNTKIETVRVIRLPKEE